MNKRVGFSVAAMVVIMLSSHSCSVDVNKLPDKPDNGKDGDKDKQEEVIPNSCSIEVFEPNTDELGFRVVEAEGSLDLEARISGTITAIGTPETLIYEQEYDASSNTFYYLPLTITHEIVDNVSSWDYRFHVETGNSIMLLSKLKYDELMHNHKEYGLDVSGHSVAVPCILSHINFNGKIELYRTKKQLQKDYLSLSPEERLTFDKDYKGPVDCDITFISNRTLLDKLGVSLFVNEQSI